MPTKVLLPEKAWSCFSRDTGIQDDRPTQTFSENIDIESLSNGRFRVLSKETAQNTACVLVELSNYELWKLDAWESCFYALRKELRDGIQSYFKIKTGKDAVEHIHAFQQEEDRQDIFASDLILLIPGRIHKGERPAASESELGDYFNSQVTATVEAEFKNEFAKDIERICLGNVELYRSPECEKEEPLFLQVALVNLAIHRETRLCVLELYVPFCGVGSNYLLYQFRQGNLRIRYQGKLYQEKDFAGAIGMSLYGEKRSLVFSYGEVSEDQIVGALANEYIPMAKISGSLLEKVRHENLAQYETARVYVSSVTMIECCPMTSDMLQGRMIYQSIELFFVEQLLLNDASVDKIYQDLKQMEVELLQGECADGEERMEKLSRDLFQALRFSDYSQYLFPTVRESAQRIAKAFGIDAILSRYTANKSILSSMIAGEQRRTAKRENDIKNRFLFFLTALSVIGAVDSAIGKVNLASILEGYTYFISAGIVAILYGLYKVVIFLDRKRSKR